MDNYDRAREKLLALREKIEQDKDSINRNKSGKIAKVIQSALISLFFVFTLIVYGPITLYLNNINELWFSLSYVVGPVAFWASVVFVALFAISAMTKNKAHDIIICIIFALGIGFFIQGNFMNVQYGVLDGQEINWSQFTGWAILNTLIWIALLIFPIVLWKIKKELWNRLTILMSALLLLFQAVLLAVFLFTTPSKTAKLYYSSDGMLELGKKKNTVVFLLDTFDVSYFKEILEQSPEFCEPLDGFTFFENCVGSYPTTKGAVPYLLTGQYYENEKPYDEYINEAFQDNKFYETLSNDGYDTRLFTEDYFAPTQAADASNAQPFQYGIENLQSAQYGVTSYAEFSSMMAKFTAFSYFPHITKPMFWFYSGDFDAIKQVVNGSPVWKMDDPGFYMTLKDVGLSLSEKDNAFRFYHMYGIHPPFTMNADCQYTEESNVQEQAKGCLNIIYEYIAQMKRLGVYDDATIIIMADHGIADSNLLHQPLFIIKRPGATGSLQISDAPVSHSDFIPTILQLAGLDYADYGMSVYEAGQNTDRERRYLCYIWDDGWADQYLPAITEYLVHGPADDYTSYTPTGKRFTNKGVESIIATYQLGDTIPASDPLFNQYYLMGIGACEVNPGGDFRWTLGSRGYFAFRADTDCRNGLVIKFNLRRVYAGEQRMVVNCGEQVIFDERIADGAQSVSFTVPASLISQNNEVFLTFTFPDAVSPFSRGESGDMRELALALTSIYVGACE